MRLRQALRDPRPALDIDLVAREPLVLARVRRLVHEVLATSGADGVRFDAERFRVDDVVVRMERIGARVVAAGWVEGVGADVTVDIHRPLALGPAPRLEPLLLERGEGRLVMCAPETMIARKIRITTSRGPARFRAKDLADVHRLLTELPIEHDRLAHALEATFSDAPSDEQTALRTFVEPELWAGAAARVRWRRRSRTGQVDLQRVVGEIGRALAPHVRSVG
jgi:hypothetical protein